MTMTDQERISEEPIDPEYGVDSRYGSDEEKRREGEALMAARMERMKSYSENDIAKARLIQLRLQMEAFMEKPFYEGERYFTKSLAAYIDILYPKRKHFADAIEITPILLSQILNNHREPKEEFMQKLMIHSHETFKEISHFNEKLWYLILFQDRLAEMMERQTEWRPVVSKHVHTRSLS